MNDLILILILAIGLSSCYWFMICNNKTFTQRRVILNNISKSNNTPLEKLHLLNLFEMVDYNTHLWSRFAFANPKFLYPKQIQNLWGGVDGFFEKS